jgi:hypothetical protein
MDGFTGKRLTAEKTFRLYLSENFGVVREKNI